MPRQSFHSSRSQERSTIERSSFPPPYNIEPPPPPPFDHSTDHLSFDDRLYHKRYHEVRNRLVKIIKAASERVPRITNPWKPNFDPKPPSEAEKKVLAEWLKEMLSNLEDSVDLRRNYLNAGNYHLISKKLTELEENAKKLVVLKTAITIRGKGLANATPQIAPRYSPTKIVEDLALTPHPPAPTYTSPRQSSQTARPHRSEHSLAQHRRIGYRQAFMRKLRTDGQARDGGLLL